MMDDPISRRDAINVVSEITTTMSVCTNKDECYGMKRMQKQAITELANLPSAQPKPCEDAVSREAVLSMIDTYMNKSVELHYLPTSDGIKKLISILPSAQPDIIYCKDCKWYGRADKRRFYRGMDCLKKRIDTIVPDRDFCSKAERREDG